MGSGGSISEGGENKGNIIEVEFNLQRTNGNINEKKWWGGGGVWGREVEVQFNDMNMGCEGIVLNFEFVEGGVEFCSQKNR